MKRNIFLCLVSMLGFIVLNLWANPQRVGAVTNPVTDTLGVVGTIDSAITFSLTGNTIRFGALSSSVIKFGTTGADGVSGTPSAGFPAAVSGTSLSVSTNAVNGVLITIQDLNNGLKHSAHTEEVIAATTPSNVAGQKYFAYGRIDSGTGLALTTGFNGIAASGTLSTAVQTLASSTGPINANTASVIFGAGRTSTTVATTGAETYADTVTIICTNRY